MGDRIVMQIVNNNGKFVRLFTGIGREKKVLRSSSGSSREWRIAEMTFRIGVRD